MLARRPSGRQAMTKIGDIEDHRGVKIGELHKGGVDAGQLGGLLVLAGLLLALPLLLLVAPFWLIYKLVRSTAKNWTAQSTTALKGLLLLCLLIALAVPVVLWKDQRE